MKMQFGILGAARIAAGALIPAIGKSSNAQVAGVAARELSRAQAYAQQHGIGRVYGSYAEMLADPQIQAIYNPLPNSEHVPLSLQALQAGKHVLCEKPLAMNAAEAQTLADAAQQSGLVAMEAFMYRFHPQIAQVQQLLDSRALGELRLIRASFSYTQDNPHDIRWVQGLGGGALYDIGTYCVNVARTFAGREPLEVWGRSDLTPASHSGGGGVDHSFVGMLDFGEGLRCQFDCSFVQPFYQQVELVGTAGTVVLQDPYVPGRDSQGRDHGHGRLAPRLLHNGQPLPSVAADQYQLMVEHFVQAARGEVALRYPLSEAVAQMRVLDGLFASAKSGLPVKL